MCENCEAKCDHSHTLLKIHKPAQAPDVIRSKKAARPVTFRRGAEAFQPVDIVYADPVKQAWEMLKEYLFGEEY
jgi:hypothetical protein